MSLSITASHDHLHRHNERAHGGACTCRACRYDGTVTDLLRLRSAVERIAGGGDPGGTGAAPAPHPAGGGGPALPPDGPLRTVERLNDELENYRYHRPRVWLQA